MGERKENGSRKKDGGDRKMAAKGGERVMEEWIKRREKRRGNDLIN